VYGHCTYAATQEVVMPQHGLQITLCFANGSVRLENYRQVQGKLINRDPEYLTGRCSCPPGYHP
jgi:hypothetical protein